MPSLFPGMDPYLEQPAFWSSFHSRLIVAIADALAPSLRPKYYVEVETRTYLDILEDELLVGIPDAVVLSSKAIAMSDTGTGSESTNVALQVRPKQVIVPLQKTLVKLGNPVQHRHAITPTDTPKRVAQLYPRSADPTPVKVNERYLEVRELGTDTVVTVIEVLSPKNKRKGEGRTVYETKRRTILGSLSHLVEIDLLRGGEPMAFIGDDTAAHYRILVSRRHRRPTADLYGFSLREPIPLFPLPLLPGEEELVVDLQVVLNGVYDRAGYDARINYRQPPPPPVLSQADRQWLDELLAPVRESYGTSKQ